MTPRSSLFIAGPAGTGKTTSAIQHIRSLLAEDVSPERMLVLVPQRALGQPYNLAFAHPDWPAGALTDIVTLGGLARRGLEIFWPLIAEKAGFAQPRREPHFLTIETAQYFMAGFVNEDVKSGVFDSVSMTPFDIMRQTLDNLSKQWSMGFPWVKSLNASLPPGEAAIPAAPRYMLPALILPTVFVTIVLPTICSISRCKSSYI